MLIDEKDFKRIALFAIIGLLLLLAFFILKPILLTTIAGLILALIFYPVQKRLVLKIKRKNISALIICIFVLIIIVIPLWFFVPMLVKQTFDLYVELQKSDMGSLVTIFFPSASSEFIRQTAVTLNSFIANLTSSFLSSFSDLILNTPIIALQGILILFVFFFGLRDGDQLVSYLRSISPFSKESNDKVIKQFEDITRSVVFGQVIIGLVQGIVTGIGFFIFGVPNALLLTIVATLVGIFPIIGPWLVWIPVDIYLFLSGRTGAGFGLLIYGSLIINWIDTLIRPLIVSKKTKINPAIILVSMVGGLIMFGVLGLVIGPLVISYLLLLLEFYRKNTANSSLVENCP